MFSLVASFLAGGIVFSAVILFMVGATQKQHEEESYRKGFKAGYKARYGQYVDDGKKHVNELENMSVRKNE